jgi:pimeloyl-ACP methyl ester carboxylesterase
MEVNSWMMLYERKINLLRKYQLTKISKQNLKLKKLNIMNSIKKQLALIAAIVIYFLPQNASAQTVSKGVKNIVLVHGAFADGSSWSKVITQLQAKGYNVVSVQNPLTSLAEDVATAKRAIAQMDGPVLLVAHSYGGMVITQAGNDPKVAGLLYVAALVPEEGQNANAVNATMPTTGVEKKFQVTPDGFVFLSVEAVNQNFVPDATREERNVVYATQVPLAASAGEEKVHNPAWKTKPSWFIVAAYDKVINPDLERYKAKLIKANTIELKSGHVPMISQPGKVTAFIISAAQAL